MSPSGADVEALRRAGLRVTRPRLAVLSALRERPHADADAVARLVRVQSDAISTQAVYDVLRVLTERSLARQIEPAGSSAVYELRVGDNHHHVVCRRCGAVADVDCVAGAAPCLAPADAAGFIVDEAEVTFWGSCPTCQTRLAPGRHETRDTDDEQPGDSDNEQQRVHQDTTHDSHDTSHDTTHHEIPKGRPHDTGIRRARERQPTGSHDERRRESGAER